MSGTPFNKSEKCFRRYEPLLDQYVKYYPSTLPIKHLNFSAATCASQARDAITFILSTQLSFSTLLDLTRLKEIWNESHIKIEDGVAIIQPKVAAKQEASLVELAVLKNTVKKEHVLAYALLITDGIILGPIDLHGHDSSFNEEIEDNFDVSFIEPQHANDTWKIL